MTREPGDVASATDQVAPPSVETQPTDFTGAGVEVRAGDEQARPAHEERLGKDVARLRRQSGELRLARTDDCDARVGVPAGTVDPVRDERATASGNRRGIDDRAPAFSATVVRRLAGKFVSACSVPPSHQ